uniref:EF-hand domain-containing protein n=1 Tax=Felis catus TaxID=9685 RepID=A0ABI7ZAW5_FELCA
MDEYPAVQRPRHNVSTKTSNEVKIDIAAILCAEAGRGFGGSKCSLSRYLIGSMFISTFTPTFRNITSSSMFKVVPRTTFSLETCRIMIAMLDRDYTGKMRFSEFKELWAALNAWKQNFMTIDQDQSGTVEHHELNQAIAAMGYRLSPQTLTAIVKRYSKNGRIFFDDYVACCVKLRALTDFFRRRDHLQQGVVNFVYDDFLQGTMAI